MRGKLDILRKIQRLFTEMQQPGIPDPAGCELEIFRRNFRITEKIVEYALQISLKVKESNMLMSLSFMIKRRSIRQ